MIEAVQTFLATLKEQEHLLPLIHNANLQVALQTKQETTLLAIKNREIFILPELANQQEHIVISGNIKALKQLLEGKGTLRFLTSKGLLKVSASFRTTLLLESIFYLTNSQERQHAKIN
ncbi:MAG: hypothetical protein K6T88_15780 [Bacillus sp. (in: Bacteria)]|nr:hypothetical protein [Bacillus sp. (in: firmicutes)]